MSDLIMTTVETREKLKSLAREAIRCALQNDPKYGQRRAEALQEFQAVADPLTIIELLTDFEVLLHEYEVNT